MFDFEKFPVYLKSENIYAKILDLFKVTNIDSNLKDQLKRASLSIVLNIAEGAGKYSKNDKKNFYIIARGSVHECVVIMRILKLEKIIDNHLFLELHDDFSEVSKMLSALINTMFKR